RVLDQEERQRLFDATRRYAPAWYPLLLTYDRAGLRLGEGLALEPDDIRFVAGKINIRRALDERTRTLGKPKHGPRLVDLAPGLADVLAAHIAGLKRAASSAGSRSGAGSFRRAPVRRSKRATSAVRSPASRVRSASAT